MHNLHKFITDFLKYSIFNKLSWPRFACFCLRSGLQKLNLLLSHGEFYADEDGRHLHYAEAEHVILRPARTRAHGANGARGLHSAHIVDLTTWTHI